MTELSDVPVQQIMDALDAHEQKVDSGEVSLDEAFDIAIARNPRECGAATPPCSSAPKIARSVHQHSLTAMRERHRVSLAAVQCLYKDQRVLRVSNVFPSKVADPLRCCVVARSKYGVVR